MHHLLLLDKCKPLQIVQLLKLKSAWGQFNMNHSVVHWLPGSDSLRSLTEGKILSLIPDWWDQSWELWGVGLKLIYGRLPWWSCFWLEGTKPPALAFPVLSPSIYNPPLSASPLQRSPWSLLHRIKCTLHTHSLFFFKILKFISSSSERGRGKGGRMKRDRGKRERLRNRKITRDISCTGSLCKQP